MYKQAPVQQQYLLTIIASRLHNNPQLEVTEYITIHNYEILHFKVLLIATYCELIPGYKHSSLKLPNCAEFARMT